MIKLQLDEIVEISQFGYDETYDLEVEHEDHSFFANEISVSNCHAISYAYNSYHCAWLFYHYPEQWMPAVLENDPDKEAAIEEVQALGYKIGKLDILKSDKSWKIEGKTCVPSLLSIKGFGDAAIDELLLSRSELVLAALSNKETVSPVDLFNSFFYDIEVKELKGGKIKQKKIWRWSKFNKRPLDALIRLEAFESFGLVGKNCIFKNYAHFHRTLIGNWGSRERESFNLEELALRTDATEWTTAEVIENQQTLLGGFDKNLLMSAELLDTLRESGIDPLSDLARSAACIWFILKSVTVKKTKLDKNYYKLIIMDITGQEYNLNYFSFPPKEGWGINSVYVGKLYKNGAYINVERNTFLEKIA